MNLLNIRQVLERLCGCAAPSGYETPAVEAAPDYDPEQLPIARIDDFTEAVLAACRAAKPGDVVILSPACASFDHFKNFMERGAAFKKIIYELPEVEGE